MKLPRMFAGGLLGIALVAGTLAPGAVVTPQLLDNATKVVATQDPTTNTTSSGEVNAAAKSCLDAMPSNPRTSFRYCETNGRASGRFATGEDTGAFVLYPGVPEVHGGVYSIGFERPALGYIPFAKMGCITSSGWHPDTNMTVKSGVAKVKEPACTSWGFEVSDLLLSPHVKKGKTTYYKVAEGPRSQSKGSVRFIARNSLHATIENGGLMFQAIENGARASIAWKKCTQRNAEGKCIKRKTYIRRNLTNDSWLKWGPGRKIIAREVERLVKS